MHYSILFYSIPVTEKSINKVYTVLWQLFRFVIIKLYPHIHYFLKILRFGGWPVLSLCCEGSGGARAGLDGAITPSETSLAPVQPPQGFPNYFPVF